MIEISVIIPTFNRAARLSVLLKKLCQQTEPMSGFEVIVVVDGSTDDTREMLAHLDVPYTLRVINQDNSGQAAARNRGVAESEGKVCLFLDDDMVPDGRLIAEHLRIHRKQDRIIGIGHIILKISPDSDWFVRAYAQGWLSHYARLNQGIRKPNWLDCYGGNLSVPRADFLKVGGFPAETKKSHDIELGYLLEEEGLSFIYNHDAVSYQDEHKGFRELSADAEKAGASWVDLCKNHPSMFPDLLGTLVDSSQRERLVRNIFWKLKIHPRILAFLGLFFIKHSWKYQWHRFLRSYCFWRGAARSINNAEKLKKISQGIPILMYHAFAGPNEPSGDYVLHIRRFEKQMTWLKRRGYNVISLGEYLRYRREFQLPPARSVVITIDDGYVDSLKLAYPILCRLDFPVTFFLVSDKIGKINDWSSDPELAGRPLMSLQDIQEMKQDGIQFGAHTRTHLDLRKLSEEQIKEEVQDSKRELEANLNMSIRLFAYPYGEYDSTVQNIAENSGFEGICSVQPGLNSLATPINCLRRTEIAGTKSFFHFLLSIWTGCSQVRPLLKGHI